MFLLDTNVVSELRKIGSRRADPQVTAWAQSMDASLTFLSCVSIQELETGILLVERRDQQQGAVLRRWYEHHVLPTFAGRLLAVDAAVARCCAKLHVPNPRPARDAFIGATALVHQLTLVTRNTTDFELMGASLFNPWSALRPS
ncbi:PIN domain-containing protein [Halochromatium sp.]